VPLHLGVTIGLLGGGSIALLVLLPPGPIPLAAWIAAVCVVLAANLVEYALHRWPMHRVIPSIPVLLASMAFVLTVLGVLTLTMGTTVGFFASGVLGLYGTLAQLLHLAFHLPDRWMKLPFLRSRVFQAMKLHHTIHHDLRLMTKWNFNVGIPIFDALFGTLIWEREAK